MPDASTSREHHNHGGKQKDKTIKYWDAFYSSAKRQKDGSGAAEAEANQSAEPKCINGSASNLEWIVTSSPQLMDTITTLFPTYDGGGCNESAVNVLEIGCGVSQLSSSLLRRLLEDNEAKPTRASYNFVASDISSVCIEHNRTRDDGFISSLQSQSANGRLRYIVLDILDEKTLAFAPPNERYDIILDKGTLDTFMFRSKRTKKGATHHPPLLTPLLNNIHRLLRANCEAKYIIISPRPRIKSVREFRGFASVRRMKVDVSSLQDCAAVLVKGNGNNAAHAQSEVYLYECRRNEKYDPENDTPYAMQGPSTDDKSECPKCGISFLHFRGNHKDLCDAGEAVWARRWKMHAVHCKVQASKYPNRHLINPHYH